MKRNLRNEIGKSRKIYFWDLGIRNTIIQNLNTLEYRNDIGALWENFCISERLKYQNYILDHKIINNYFWRTYEQKEVDYIEEMDARFNVYEFKWSSGKKPKLPKLLKEKYAIDSYAIIDPDNFIHLPFV